MLPDPCGSNLFRALPDDVFTVMCRSLSQRDVCSLGLCCRGLKSLVASEKVWFSQCETLGLLSSDDVVEWRKGVSSYKSLVRFLYSVRPLLGIWVHQNPELGNVVYVMPGYLSVVGCRILPQEIGPLGLEDDPLLWAPVFEIIGDFDGSMAFFLHGQEKDGDFFYPGSLKAIDRACNVLLLEVEQEHSKSLVHPHSDLDSLRRICRSDSGLSRSQRVAGASNPPVPFSRLTFGDRRRLLELVLGQIRFKVPELGNGLLFPALREDDETIQKDMLLLSERRLLLLEMYRLGGDCTECHTTSGLPSGSTQMISTKIKRSLDQKSGCQVSNEDEVHLQSTKKKTFAGYFKDRLKQILERSSTRSEGRARSRNGSSGSENKHVPLHEFLRSGDMIGLSLHASTMKLSTYRAWPNMHDNRFALYKLPTRLPTAGREYAGLWGGTFGWPPGRSSEDKPGKALFFLLLSYEESEGQLLLIATKILEGTHYVLHPNGSAMFVVNVDELSMDTFPWETDGESINVSVKHAYNGEGIANGYGFRYPGSKPGSLFVIQDGLLAFVWKESRVVLTLERINLQELLKKGERVPALPPIVNFAYLTKSYSNVFTGFTGSPDSFSSASSSEPDCHGEA